MHRLTLIRAGIPVEVCASSNARTLRLPNLHDHPTLSVLLREEHPVTISTDDPGVFDTTVSRELFLVARAFGLDAARVASICLEAPGMTFADEHTRGWLRRQLEEGVLHATERHAASMLAATGRAVKQAHPAAGAASVGVEDVLSAVRGSTAVTGGGAVLSATVSAALGGRER